MLITLTWQTRGVKPKESWGKTTATMSNNNLTGLQQNTSTCVVWDLSLIIVVNTTLILCHAAIPASSSPVFPSWCRSFQILSGRKQTGTHCSPQRLRTAPTRPGPGTPEEIDTHKHTPLIQRYTQKDWLRSLWVTGWRNRPRLKCRLNNSYHLSKCCVYSVSQCHWSEWHLVFLYNRRCTPKF